MPQVIFSSGALRNIERLREFLRPKNPAAAERAAASIIQAILLLEQHPQIGRVIEGTSGKIRDLSIPFGLSPGMRLKAGAWKSWRFAICAKRGSKLNTVVLLGQSVNAPSAPRPKNYPNAAIAAS